MPSARVGVDSVLVADVPVEESAPFRRAAMRHNIAPISSARPMRMTIYCARLPLMAAATPICCRARSDGCGKSRRAAAAPPVEKLAEYHAAPPLQGYLRAGAGERRH